MKESALVSKIIREVKKAYPRIYIRKISDRFTRGMPDILIVVRCCQYQVQVEESGEYAFPRYERREFPISLFVECKTKKGKLSKLQELELESIKENGSEAIVATDVDTVLSRLAVIGVVK